MRPVWVIKPPHVPTLIQHDMQPLLQSHTHSEHWVNSFIPQILWIYKVHACAVRFFLCINGCVSRKCVHMFFENGSVVYVLWMCAPQGCITLNLVTCTLVWSAQRWSSQSGHEAVHWWVWFCLRFLPAWDFILLLFPIAWHKMRLGPAFGVFLGCLLLWFGTTS